MAKEGAKQLAVHQELVAELRELTAANIKKDGTSRADAVPQELKRIEELKALLAGKPAGGIILPPAGTPSAEGTTTATAGTETAEQVNKRLRQENAALKAERARGRDATKIRSQEKKVGYVPRPDEIMSKALADAEERDPSIWDESNRLAVERTIRRFVRKGGARKDHKGDFYDIPAGFKKGITLEEKIYALTLLAKLGRLKGEVAEVAKLVTDREKMTVSAQRQTNTEFNGRLEALGIAWDDSIQVPGMSQTLRS